jgi:hypothetical protein
MSPEGRAEGEKNFAQKKKMIHQHEMEMIQVRKRVTSLGAIQPRYYALNRIENRRISFRKEREQGRLKFY